MVVPPILSAVPFDAQLIFVGDEDQLPSVGPGQVFKDLIESKAIPRVNLTEVYRRQDGSSIIEFSTSNEVGSRKLILHSVFMIEVLLTVRQTKYQQLLRR